MSLIVLPSTLGVALPCNNYDITINHPYFKKALEHADTVENFVIAFVNSMDLFDDPSKIDEVSVPLISCFACVCEFREYKNVVKNDLTSAPSSALTLLTTGLSFKRISINLLLDNCLIILLTAALLLELVGFLR